jgi:hypothetical protein
MLINHQKTIEDLVVKGFEMIIPMRLGTIVGSTKEVIKILSNGHDLFIDTLNKILYLTEMDITACWADFQGILTEIAQHPEIVEMKDSILNKTDTLLHVDQIAVGMLVQSKLKEKNSKVELDILEALSSSSADIKTHEVMNDQMVTNSAFLINKNKLEQFELVIEKLDEKFNGLLNFKIIGPLPCYSFFTSEVKELNPDHVIEAKKELELNEETSELDIKRAYLEKAKKIHPDAIPINGENKNFSTINKAYHTVLDYSLAARQSSKDEYISLAKEKVIENLILVKIRE